MSEIKIHKQFEISSLPLYVKYDLLAQRVAMVFDYERNGFNFGQEEQKGSSGRKLSTRITCPVKQHFLLHKKIMSTKSWYTTVTLLQSRPLKSCSPYVPAILGVLDLKLHNLKNFMTKYQIKSGEFLTCSSFFLLLPFFFFLGFLPLLFKYWSFALQAYFSELVLLLFWLIGGSG